MNQIFNLFILLNFAFLSFAQYQSPQNPTTIDHYCNNPYGCTFVCTHNNRCQGVYVCGPNAASISGGCTFSCTENDSCHDAIFVSLTPKKTDFNCFGENGCHQSQMFCGSVPPALAGQLTQQPVQTRALQKCSFLCGKNSCHDMQIVCNGVKDCSIRAQAQGGGFALENSNIHFIKSSAAGSSASLFCGGGSFGAFEPQCAGSRMFCPNGGCSCSGPGCAGVMVQNLNGKPKPISVPNSPVQKKAPVVTGSSIIKNTKNPLKIPFQHPQRPVQLPLNRNIGGSSTIPCDQTMQCLRRTNLCLQETCQYECLEAGSCLGARFVSSPITQNLEILCKKRDACRGIEVVSSAINTRVYCDEFSCINIKLFCKSQMGEKCELSCQNDGCHSEIQGRQTQVPGGMGVYPVTLPIKLNRKYPGHMVQCEGNYRECVVKVSSAFSFMNSQFVCAVGMGSCLLECADNFGEVSCKNSKYRCYSSAAQCQCHDQFNSNNFFNFGLRAHQGMNKKTFKRDCPVVLFPTQSPTMMPTTTTAAKTTAARVKNLTTQLKKSTPRLASTVSTTKV